MIDIRAVCKVFLDKLMNNNIPEDNISSKIKSNLIETKQMDTVIEKNKIKMSLNPELANIMQEYISDFVNKQNLPYVVKPAIPIVWFGNMEKYSKSPKKIVTVGLNPSLEEFGEKRFNIIDLEGANATDELAKTLNLYFESNPYTKWFRFFENILSLLDASYYDNNATNTAIHIDIYSAIATNPTWGNLSDIEKSDIQRIDLFKKLLKILNPDIIVFSANQKVFDDVFYQFKLEKCADNIGDKKGFFIRKYKNGDKILVSGRNYKGQPFGGMTDYEIEEAINQLMCK